LNRLECSFNNLTNERPGKSKMDISELAKVLATLGCPAEKSGDMAVQLDKRAKQLAVEKNRSYDEALKHLLTLMKQGWAASKNS
jgi:hypothetical protein